MSPQIPTHVLDALKAFHPDSAFTSSSRGIISATPSQNSMQYLYKAASMPAVQLLGEAESIQRMSDACPGVIPRLLASGDDDGSGKAWMLSEWHEMGSLSSHQAQLGELLGKMHQAPAPQGQKYGFPMATCCGVTQQDNTEENSWSAFFGKRRIGDMLDRIGDAELSRVGEELKMKVISRLLDKLDIKPVILHGDLWSGNASYSKTASAAITFDPASYYGHSEADIGITRMFGGFTKEFYDAYHKVVPKTEPLEEYEQRLQLYELYHHLNHTLMFGGSYRSGAMRIMKSLLAWEEGQEL